MEAKLSDRDDRHRVIAGHQGGDFSTENDARTAMRLADASYKAGRDDLARELRELLNIRNH